MFRALGREGKLELVEAFFGDRLRALGVRWSPGLRAMSWTAAQLDALLDAGISVRAGAYLSQQVVFGFRVQSMDEARENVARGIVTAYEEAEARAESYGPEESHNPK